MNEWSRVTKYNPCKICGKVDWCTYNERGACCMRVESPHPMRNGGWWHRHDVTTTHFLPASFPKKQAQDKTPDFDSILANGDHNKLESLSIELHVTTDSLIGLGTVYLSMYHAYGFPMYYPNGKVVGIRLRNNQGHKWAIRGSHAGLFIPFRDLANHTGELFICEGPTDTAAALTLGLYAIGRHACLGQEEMILQLIKDNRIKRVYICTDNDRPGRQGASKLAKMIKCKWSIFIPPAKDLREFVSFGGTKNLLFSTLNEIQSVV